MKSKALRLGAGGALVVLAALLAVLVPGQATSSGTTPAASASGWNIVKFPEPQPACTGVGLRGSLYFDTLSCGFGTVAVSETTPTSSVTFTLVGSDGKTIETQAGAFRTEDSTWEFEITPKSSWPSGAVEIHAATGGADVGSTTVFVNALGATAAPVSKTGGYRPGDPIALTGKVFQQKSLATSTQKTGVPATFSLTAARPDGTVKGPYGPYTAAGDGTFAVTLPADATAGLAPTRDTNWEQSVGIHVVDASYKDTLTGAWTAKDAEAGAATVSQPPTGLALENSFVSSVGWVKPGDSYPFRVIVRNYEATPKLGASLTIPAVDGTAFTKVSPNAGTATVNATTGAITWTIGTVAAGSGSNPTTLTLVVEGKAKTAAQDPKVVWKNLSSTASLTWTGGTAVTAKSHGPKVIPTGAQFDSARYGDRPFPVIPVDYADRPHGDGHSGDVLASIINSPAVPGSTFNLYQEMSYGQLFPHADIPSAGVASAGWDAAFTGYRKSTGFQFTTLAPAGTCHGATLAGQQGTALLPERVKDGWYQLPGTTDYYGDDKYGSAIIGASTPVAALMDIDSACGPTGKLVYDAAMAADPDIDFSDFDTDKDGVVDFFMVVFAGLGGNGDSQINGLPSYDNIWPHSSSLEFTYTDPETGLKGYITDDQLKDLEGRPLFYTDSSRTKMTTATTVYPVYVRVGPYNVNPESAIDKHSVISHEYGHSLGLPDFYTLGTDRETYGSWMLMATDYSQNMDVFGKQELGWLVPRVLKPGTTTVSGWKDSKTNTHQIDWVQPDGTPYTLTGSTVDNGQAYVAKLPSRQIIDPSTVPSGSHVWWSQAGNDFGCAPKGGHNLDIPLPQLATVPAGTPVTLSFKSSWQTEWDYDYGYVLTTTDGETYSSVKSAKGYTTESTFNPNANACQTQYGNGLTGSSASWAAGTQTVDRVTGTYPASTFVDDSYDLSSLAGQPGAVLRFSYATDPGLAKQGWFIDDVKITAGDTVIYSSDFENGADDPALYNGGCKDTLMSAKQCTPGWQYVSAVDGSAADHAYYLEMRDRSGFDAKDGHGQADRGDISFLPGLYLMYTDETHGYGNVGTGDPPAQTPLDANPEPGNNLPNLDDAAFNQGESFSDSGAGHVDNYKDPSSADGNWHFTFDCLGFDVTSMSGDDIGPDTAPGNLVGDVTFRLGGGCGAYDYGHATTSAPANTAPVAVAQVKTSTVKAGKKLAFNGSNSYDAEDAPSELTYAWDFDGNGTVDATGQSAMHAYPAAGVYKAVLKVTDTAKATGSDTVSVVVSAK